MIGSCRVDHPDCLQGLPPGCRCGIAWRAAKASALPAPVVEIAPVEKRKAKR